MSNPSDQLSDEQTESSFDQPENEHEIKGQTGFAAHGVTGGKIPTMSGEVEGE